MPSEQVQYHSVEEVLNVVRSANGQPFKKFDVNHRLEKEGNKGALGQIVEEGILGYAINSSPEADIKNLNLEIKATGIVKSQKKNSYRAKERLALETINYIKVVNQPFEESELWKKCRLMLLVFYEYIYGVQYGDFEIIDSVINEFTEKDLEIIRKDYEIIVNKIKEGKAEEISEGDTMYLGACTAGTGRLQNQPYSSIKAKQRKFCIKVSYFNQIVEQHFEKRRFENALQSYELRDSSFELAMESNFSKYYGWSEKQIREHFKLKISSDAKNRYERYIAAMLGLKGDINETEEFLKSGTTLKTIRIGKNGHIRESMSFPAFSFIDIAKQDWEESELKDFFENQKFMFAIFEEGDEEMIFRKIKFWNMPPHDIENSIKPMFMKMQEVLNSGNIVSHITYNNDGKEIWHNNFPKMKENEVAHVRPHGRNKDDVNPLPVKDNKTGATSFTKQCFWLNSGYVEKIIK